MKKYYKCNLQDLLIDEDFKFCIWEQVKGNSHFWEDLLKQNPEHACTFFQAQEILLSLGQKASSLTEEELNHGVKAIMLHTKQQRGLFPKVNKFQWLSIAASVVMIIGVIIFKSKYNQPSSTYSEIIANVTTSLQEIVNKSVKDKRIMLPDGSIVVLSPSSKISYSNPFVQNSRREIYLSGDAFFDIQKDTLNPLFVYAKGLRTRVVGTSFLIKTTKNEVKVMVRTGRVSVTPIRKQKRARAEDKELFLIPNQQALFSTTDNEISKTIVDFPKEIKKEQRMSFENKPISEVFGVLEKAYGIPFIYDQLVIAKCLLRVEFTDESLFERLDIITQTIDGRYSVIDGRVLISGKGCN